MDYHEPSKNYLVNNSLLNLKDDYLAVLANLKEITKISSQSRLEKYNEELCILSSFTDSITAAAEIVQNNLIRAAFIESHQVIQVSNFLSNYVKTKSISEENIKKLQGGVYSYADSINSDESRNTFFEFLVASHLSHVGIEVDLSSVTDVIAQLEDYKFFIECKRISSANKYADRIKEAVKQLNQRFTKGKVNEVGLVFISITKVVNPNLDVMNSSNTTEMFVDSQQKCESLANKKLKDYDPAEKKILGVYNHLTCPYFDQQHRLVNYRTHDFFKSFFRVDMNGNPIRPNQILNGAPKAVLRNKYFDIWKKFDKKFGQKVSY